jgi:Holliday junction DNA helicase RuvA
MIGRLTGRVLEDVDGGVVLDVNGVGYDVMIPLGTLGRAARDADDKVTLFVHTHVREDALLLFGFASDADRLAFRTLIGVSNVGPKTAIQVLSSLPAADLGLAIARKELGKLTGIPGIGKKTAERLLLELKDKLQVLDVVSPRAAVGAAGPAPAPSSNIKELLTRALLNMGYRQAEAERAVDQLGARLTEAPMPDLVKEALSLLSK